jgi:hypothetical protein
MPVARSTTETFTYVTLADRQLPAERQTTFSLRRLSTKLMLSLNNLREGDAAAIGSWMTVALRAGLAGWTNLCDPDGAPVEFSMDPRPAVVCGIELTRSASEASVNRLAVEDATEISIAIMRGNSLTADDAKN